MKYVISILFFSLASILQAEPDEVGNIEKLSPEIRQLLSKEMLAVEQGMKDIITANLAGDNEKVALVAQKMKDSFILKQGLSQEQMYELHSVLPPSFIELDQRFHYYAGMLSHAASNNKVELVSFYYSKLFESCSGCHQKYVKFRFSNFEKSNKTKVHQH